MLAVPPPCSPAGRGTYPRCQSAGNTKLSHEAIQVNEVASFGDINPFVRILTNPGAWQAAHPGCPALNGDINGDGTIDFGDINPFVALLSGAP